MSVSLPSWVLTHTMLSCDYAPSEHLDQRAEHHFEIYHVDTEEKFAYLTSILSPNFKLRLKLLECNSQGQQKWVYGGSEVTTSPYCVVPVITTIKKYYLQGWSCNESWPGSVHLGELLDLVSRSPQSAKNEQVNLYCSESLTHNESLNCARKFTSCKYLYRKGERKGQTCGKAGDASGYCTACRKKKGVQKLLASKPCVYVFRDGEACGRPAFGSDYCVSCRKKKAVKKVLMGM